LLSPRALAERARASRDRRATEDVLARLPSAAAPTGQSCVLVDAMYDNPNYWIRYAMLRAALGLAHGHEIGVLGPYRARQCRRTLHRLEVSDTVRITDLRGAVGTHRAAASRLL